MPQSFGLALAKRHRPVEEELHKARRHEGGELRDKGRGEERCRMGGKRSDDELLHAHAAKPHADKDRIATSRPIRHVEGVLAVEKEAQRKANRHAHHIGNERIPPGPHGEGEEDEHVNGRAYAPKERVRHELS